MKWTQADVDKANKRIRGDLKPSNGIPYKMGIGSIIRLNIAPLSVNVAYQGRKFRTKKYDKFESEVIPMLPELHLPAMPYEIHYKFGFSSKLNDVDNSIKTFQDLLAKKYNFSDRYIQKIISEKELVERGKEYCEFSIKTYKP